MSSNENGRQAAFDVEEFRKQLLNYRTKPDDSDLDSSLPIDLDSNFKQLLHEKRQMTNKENNPPPSSASIASPASNATTINPPEKPLRKDLLKERLLSRIHDDSLNASGSHYHTLDTSASYIFQNTITNDAEYATINRLMADFNLNRDSMVNQKRSPLKAIRLTSEEETHVHASRSSIRIERSSSFSAIDNRAEQQVNNSINQSTAQADADDTLEEIEYVLDRGLNYVPKRLRAQMESDKHNESTTTDENAENYVTSSESKYKHEAKDGEKSESAANASTDDIENDENDENISQKSDTIRIDEDVIVIESSPENSFKTVAYNTQNFKSIVESIDNTFYTAKTHIQSKSSLSINDESIECVDDSIEEKVESNKIDAKRTNESFDRSFDDGFNEDEDNSSVRYGEMPDFNDTLERVEYMMQQGQKMLKNKPTPVTHSVHTQTPTKAYSPVVSAKKNALTPGGGAVKKVLPTSTTKKTTPAKHATPIKNDVFKRPEQRGLNSPCASATKAAASRIPKPKQQPLTAAHTPVSSLLKPQFRHIASPIAAYINNTPEIPLMKTIKPMKSIDVSDYNKKLMGAFDHDESTQSIESFPTKSSLPCKMYISAPQRQIIDHRYIVTPGGKSVQKLIGNAPLVIRHDGKIKTSAMPSAPKQLEESLSDLSMLSGDVSVQVVKDVHRKH